MKRKKPTKIKYKRIITWVMEPIINKNGIILFKDATVFTPSLVIRTIKIER